MEPNDPTHILGEFDAVMKQAKDSVLEMASKANENLERAVKGLLENNEDLCNQAIVDDEEVNAYERSIDREGMDILLRFNPVASDLRSVVAFMKIATNLERIADQAENIARAGRKILRKAEVEAVELVEPVYLIASEILEDAVQSLEENDVGLALTLHDRDCDLDKLHKSTVKSLTTAIEEDTDNLRSYLNLILIVRCLERVGDYSVNIGEDVVYMTEATDIRHVGMSAFEEKR